MSTARGIASETGTGFGRLLRSRVRGSGRVGEAHEKSPALDGAEQSYRRQVEAQIAQYAETGIHGLPPMAHWYNRTILKPRIQHVFGAGDLHELYARHIANACARSGCDLAVSLGSGDGAVEIGILHCSKSLGLPPFRMLCLELSPVLAARARDAAGAAGLGEQLVVVEADLNQELPVSEPVGAFMAHHALHHVVELEKLFARVESLLAPEGLFITADMIGRNGHMRWPETLGPLRELWSTLPERLIWNHTTQKHDFWLENPDCSVEGFEGIRAQDILPLLIERFDFERFLAWGGLTDVFLDRSFGPNLDPAALLDQVFIERLHRAQDFCIATGRTKPTTMMATMRRRGSDTAGAPLCYGGLTPRLAVRPPDAEIGVRVSLAEIGWISPYTPRTPPAAPELTTGETVGFDRAARGRDLLRAGWDTSEESLTWAVGLESAIGWLPSGRQLRAVTFKTVGYVPPAAQRQRVTVWLDEVRLGEIVYAAQGAAATTRIELPAETSPARPVVLTFRTTRTRRPDVDGGADRRPLAFALLSLRTE